MSDVTIECDLRWFFTKKLHTKVMPRCSVYEPKDGNYLLRTLLLVQIEGIDTRIGHPIGR